MTKTRTSADILDNYAQQYYQLLRTPSLEAKDIKDRKRAEAQKALLEDMLAIIENIPKTGNKQSTPAGVVELWDESIWVSDITQAVKTYFGEDV